MHLSSWAPPRLDVASGEIDGHLGAVDHHRHLDVRGVSSKSRPRRCRGATTPDRSPSGMSTRRRPGPAARTGPRSARRTPVHHRHAVLRSIISPNRRSPRRQAVIWARMSPSTWSGKRTLAAIIRTTSGSSTPGLEAPSGCRTGSPSWKISVLSVAHEPTALPPTSAQWARVAVNADEVVAVGEDRAVDDHVVEVLAAGLGVVGDDHVARLESVEAEQLDPRE